MSTIVDLLQEAQVQFGTRTALVTRGDYRSKRWSYRQLWEFSGRIAAYVQCRGVNKGDRVVLLAPSSPYWVAAYFGCLRAGAVLVPLDTRSPSEFVRKVVKQTQPKLALASLTTQERLEGLGVPVTLLEEVEPLAEEVSLAREEVSTTAEDIAEVMFTSGTTGDPKGVILTHGNIVANVKAATQVVPSRPNYRLLSLLPLSHMLEQTVGLLAPLTGGASIYYLRSLQSTHIFRALKEHHITTLVLVPRALQLFINGIENRVREQGKERLWHLLHKITDRLPMPLRRRLFVPVHRQLGGSIRFVICGGAYLDPALARKWEALGVPVLQGYGTTEAAPIISCNSLKRRKLESMGTPLPSVQVKIASDDEILVRGDNVTQGYWQDPQATRAAFEDGWYRTGDMGYLDSDGFLYFKGRNKDLIVLSSGLNVHPEDIEVVLQEHPDVADAVVLGLPRRNHDVQVHAVLLLKDGDADARAVIEQTNASLAEHQHIQGFTLWPGDDFPRTHTLKVKKHEVLEHLTRLQAGESRATRANGAGAVDAPPLAQVLARLAQVPVEQIEPTMRMGDELGLDSLKRVELLAALETELGIVLDESKVSTSTTVRELEELVASTGSVVSSVGFPEWPMGRPARLIRAALQDVLLSPILRLLCRPKVLGRENLNCVEGPVIFACNHASHLDSPLALNAIPRRLRLRTSVAAAADYFFQQRMVGTIAGLLWNAFPFSRGGAVRPSIERCGVLLDKGWSVLLYPEGTRSTTGRMVPFKSGIGLIAVELRVPVIPVYVEGSDQVLPKGRLLPTPGRVTVHIGKPLAFTPETSYLKATRTIEEAVTALGKRWHGDVRIARE